MSIWKGIVGKGFTGPASHEYVGTVSFPLWRPQFVVLHNTAAPKLSQWHSVSGQQRMADLENFYKNQQHWSAGPHLFVADDLIWVFTPLNTPGVHSPSWNAISWGLRWWETTMPNRSARRSGECDQRVSIDVLLLWAAILKRYVYTRGSADDTCLSRQERPQGRHDPGCRSRDGKHAPWRTRYGAGG